ncbi:hypothetical protein Acor_57940 [Acrocarpospora corrugata]|uniref:VapC45 PIN like domain-containing protein n=1 Tax=Acrocarpospora corrugata TaxID=35763 RepID=A0A5M3WB72_9ACTN|nr:hypothetical protein [Acrocarpospora corrugata]GES03728.1 hypothetical protein Acor_57940 [Acrocarpospora corrugata]
MNSESPPPTSGSPPASSWATPPEFYLDENSVTRRVRRFLLDLGYPVHTPAEWYGSREQSLGVNDEDWSPLVGARGWVVLASDIHIFEREHEYRAYLKAGVPVFLLPGQSRVAERVELVARNLAAMCAYASQRGPGVWRLTVRGPEEYRPPAAKKRGKARGWRNRAGPS